MKFIGKNRIKVCRELSDLDKFTLDFLEIFTKYDNYVIISGYVAILLGRSRASEDVDIIIEKIDFDSFSKFVGELYQKDFYCLNTDNVKEMYSYLKDNLAIRFAKKETIIPNMEVKFPKTKFDKIALQNNVIIELAGKEIITSELELQIAFKENVLKSPKDKEDAKHVRVVTKDVLDDSLIKKYKVMLNEFYKTK